MDQDVDDNVQVDQARNIKYTMIRSQDRKVVDRHERRQEGCKWV